MGGNIKNVISSIAKVQERHKGAYCAVSIGNAKASTYLIIVPARNDHEAETGSGILAIGSTMTEAWSRAAETKDVDF